MIQDARRSQHRWNLLHGHTHTHTHTYSCAVNGNVACSASVTSEPSSEFGRGILCAKVRQNADESVQHRRTHRLATRGAPSDARVGDIVLHGMRFSM